MPLFAFRNFLICIFLFIGLGLSAQDFFGPAIQEVRMELPYPDFDVKLDSIKKANPEGRLEGTVSVNGTKYNAVGIRYKGNSSYFRTRNETYKKLPFNIKLNYRDKKQQLKEGFTSIKLSNAFLDPSFIRDPLAYEVIRKYMPAPRCNFSKVYLNNRFYGLYINTESIDELFIEKHFDAKDGHLVKCDPDNWKRVRSQSGCPKGENASLVWLNEIPGCYDAFYEVDDPAAWKPMLNLIKVLNKTPDKIETVLDVDQTLWMLALNNTLVNLDSYNGSLSHNYYLWFDSTNVAHPLIWDLNMAFGGWRRNYSFEEMTDEQIIQYSPLAEIDNSRRPLISKLLRNSTYRKIYLAHMRTIINDFLKNGQLVKRAEAMMKEIEPTVKQDELKLYTYEHFKNALDKTMISGPDHVIGIRQLMDKRTEFLLKHPLFNKPQPVITDVKMEQDGDKKRITAKFTDATAGYAFFRVHKMFAFTRVPMHDDGANGDAVAGDGIFTALIDPILVKHYYVSAENEGAAAVFPERASFEFLEN